MQAAWRELEEEIGVGEAHLVLEEQVRDWMTYELPANMKSVKIARGQFQKWFLFRISETGMKQIELGEEFNAHRWVPIQQAVDDVVEFRKAIYKRLQSEFSALISK